MEGLLPELPAGGSQSSASTGPYNTSLAAAEAASIEVFVYGLALVAHGRDYDLEHVGVEPSGDAFNSIVFDEGNNRPYNPMVNAGALVTTDLVRGKDPAEKFDRILGTLRTYGSQAARSRPRVKDGPNILLDSSRAVNACGLPVTERGHPGQACLRIRFPSIISLCRVIRR